MNRTRPPAERSYAFTNRLRIFDIAHRSLDFFRIRSDKCALEEKTAQGDTARPSSLECVDVRSFVLVQHSLQEKDAHEGSRHETVLLSHELVGTFQARKNLRAIFVGGYSGAAVVFTIHSEPIA